MSLTLWVVLAGGAGAGARFFVDGVVRARFGRRFPLGTLVVNVSGSLLLGVFSGLVLYGRGPTLWSAIGGTGFCGGFTTFSTASFETIRLIQERLYRSAWINGLGTVVLTIAAAGVGLGLSRL